MEGFQVLTAASMEMTVFWVVAPCSLGEVYRRSEVLAVSTIRAINIPVTLMMEEASASETSVNFYQTTRRNIL
jgi:hypothetical protein